MGKVIAKSASYGTSPPREGFEQVVGRLSPTDRDRILQAMIECCAERGYRASTVEEVLLRADVDRAAFDALFAGKEQCACAAVDKVMSEALASVGSIDAGVESGAGAALEVLALFERRPSYAHFALREARQGGTAAMRERYESGLRLLAMSVERARALGTEVEAPSSAARAAIGGVEAVLRRELESGAERPLVELLPSFVYAVLVPLAGSELALAQAGAAARLVEAEG
jgi:AcrR family transcriptional regulator